jgi:tetratricopeptide (TPR) repeat protein
MKKLAGIFVFLCFLHFQAFGQQEMADLLKDLDRAIAERHKFEEQKTQRIDSMKSRLAGMTVENEFALVSQIFNEYKSFIYDSAFRYALRLQSLAARLQNPVHVYNSKIDLGFVLVSAGLFNEALDSLQALHSNLLPDNLKAEYFFLIGRTCFDLGEFNRDDFYSVRYKIRGNHYLDSSRQYLSPNSPRFFLVHGLKALHTDDYEASAKAYETLLSGFPLSEREIAVAASTLSFIYTNLGRKEESKRMQITAAIADIRSATKETVALRNLAEILFYEGKVEKAYEYIKIAMDDANFYGANHRKVQVASIYPVIEARQLAIIESRKDRIAVYAVGITFFSMLLIAFGVIVYKQYKKIEVAKKIISDSNEKLTHTNHQLMDSNKIKEEYVTYYFNTTAEYISRLENLKRTMEMKLLTKNMDELRFAVHSINIKHEREELYHHFDKFFLTVFPDFVTVFQSLLKGEDRIHLKEGQLLNTELRIYALIRMGIHDTEKIARILDYSVATIYTYKTRIRNKSIVPNDEFDKRIMAVPTI